MIAGRDLMLLLADPASRFVVTPIVDADEQIGDAGIDIRLGPDIIVSKRATGATSFDASDPRTFGEALRRRQEYVRRGIGDPFHLQPGEFVIARSLEYVSLPDNVSAEALGRSSWGRLGLTIATATHIQPGFQGTITLELANVSNTPLVLQVGLRVAQLVFEFDQPMELSDELRGSEPRALGGAPGTGQGRGHEAGKTEQDNQRATERKRRVLDWRVKHIKRRRSGRYEGQVKPELSRLHQDPDLLWVAPMAIRYVVGVVGKRLSGKSSVVNFLVAGRHLRLYRLGRVIYEEAQRRGLDAGRRTELQNLGTELRSEYEPALLAKLAFERIRADHLDAERLRRPAGIVIEGFRVPEELEVWQELDFFHTFLVETDSDRVRLWRALASGALESLKQEVDESFPSDEDDQLRWFRDNVDNGPGSDDLRRLLEQARRRSAHVVTNNEFGTTALHAQLDERLIELEAAWRRRAY